MAQLQMQELEAFKAKLQQQGKVLTNCGDI